MNATLGQSIWRKNLFLRLNFSKMQPNALLAWQSFMMQKVGVTIASTTRSTGSIDLFHGVFYMKTMQILH
jgi:hypothetical protein